MLNRGWWILWLFLDILWIKWGMFKTVVKTFSPLFWEFSFGWRSKPLCQTILICRKNCLCSASVLPYSCVPSFYDYFYCCFDRKQIWSFRNKWLTLPFPPSSLYVLCFITAHNISFYHKRSVSNLWIRFCVRLNIKSERSLICSTWRACAAVILT